MTRGSLGRDSQRRDSSRSGNPRLDGHRQGMPARAGSASDRPKWRDGPWRPVLPPDKDGSLMQSNDDLRWPLLLRVVIDGRGRRSFTSAMSVPRLNKGREWVSRPTTTPTPVESELHNHHPRAPQ